MGIKISNLLKSRRFWTAVGGVVVLVVHDLIGVDETTANSLVAVAIAWIVGDSLRPTE